MSSDFHTIQADQEAENIVRTYLPEYKKGKIFSLKRLTFAKAARRATLIALAAAIFFLLEFMLLSKKVYITVNIGTPALETAKTQISVPECPIDYKIATLYFAEGASKNSRIKASEVELALDKDSKRATLVYNFKKPMDFSRGQIIFGTCSFSDKVKLKVAVKDDKFLTNAEEEKSISVGPKAQKIVMVPKNERSGVDLENVKQLKIEIEPTSVLAKNAGVYVRTLAFVTKTR